MLPKALKEHVRTWLVDTSGHNANSGFRPEISNHHRFTITGILSFITKPGLVLPSTPNDIDNETSRPNGRTSLALHRSLPRAQHPPINPIAKRFPSSPHKTSPARIHSDSQTQWSLLSALLQHDYPPRSGTHNGPAEGPELHRSVFMEVGATLRHYRCGYDRLFPGGEGTVGAEAHRRDEQGSWSAEGWRSIRAEGLGRQAVHR